MNIKEKISSRIKECMRSGNSFERDVLKTVLGEIQSKEMSRGNEMSEEECVKVFKKFKQGVEDTLGFLGERVIEVIVEKEKEIAIYDQYIPKTMELFEIMEFLNCHKEAILNANSDGQATGVAMGAFKKEGLAVDGKDVSRAVKAIRSE